jgi:hypothetical protein
VIGVGRPLNLDRDRRCRFGGGLGGRERRERSAIDGALPCAFDRTADLGPHGRRLVTRVVSRARTGTGCDPWHAHTRDVSEDGERSGAVRDGMRRAPPRVAAAVPAAVRATTAEAQTGGDR